MSCNYDTTNTDKSSYSLRSDGTAMSHASKIDYGQDPYIYQCFSVHPPPPPHKMNELKKRYNVLIKTFGRDIIHECLVKGKLKDLLGKEFDWVKTSKDITEMYKTK